MAKLTGTNTFNPLMVKLVPGVGFQDIYHVDNGVYLGTVYGEVIKVEAASAGQYSVQYRPANTLSGVVSLIVRVIEFKVKELDLFEAIEQARSK